MSLTLRHLRLSGLNAWCPRSVSPDRLVDDVAECDCLDCLETVRELATRAAKRWSVINRSDVGRRQHLEMLPILPRFSGG